MVEITEEQESVPAPEGDSPELQELAPDPEADPPNTGRTVTLRVFPPEGLTPPRGFSGF